MKLYFKYSLCKKMKLYFKYKWPQIAHHSSRIRAHRVHHRPYDPNSRKFSLKS